MGEGFVRGPGDVDGELRLGHGGLNEALFWVGEL